MDDPWEKLLETAKKVHLANSKLQDFCPFPKDIKKQEFDAFHSETIRAGSCICQGIFVSLGIIILLRKCIFVIGGGFSSRKLS